MKSKLAYLTASAAALVITTASLQAKDEPGFYVKVDAGASFLQDLKINGSDVTFNPGFRGDIGFGYNFCKSFALEFETGSIWNSVDKINGFTLPSEIDYNLYQYPFLAKAIFKLPLDNGLTPYISGGVGGVGAVFTLDAFGDDQSVSDVTFAYQAEAGLKYAISENIEVGVGYKFLGTTGYDLTGDSIFPLHTDDAFTHAVFASFTWNF
jgi:OOP family OmpA-OmpF porin